MRSLSKSNLSATLKTEAEWSSEILIPNHHTTRYSNLENHKFYLHRSENLKSRSLGVLDDRVLRRIFGHKREEVVGG
jgi:hypothetical protein